MTKGIIDAIMALADAYAQAKAGLVCATDDSDDAEERAALLAKVTELVRRLDPTEDIIVFETVPATEVIPAITDEMGAHWQQPDRSKIGISDKLAVMDNDTFLSLKEYSTTTPSGVYHGKMWRAFYDSKWYLRWYGLSTRGIANECSNQQREIFIYPKTTKATS